MSMQTGIFADVLADLREKQFRSSLENPQTPLSFPAEWMLDIFNGGRTDSGVRVSELLAFQTTVFLACCNIISSAIAALPMHIYERTMLKNGRAAHQIAYDHDIYDLISNEPNDEMTSFTLIKAFMLHALAWPAAYIEIQRDAGNRIVALWPRNPAKTRPYRASQVMHLAPEPWRPFPVTIQAGEFCFKTTDGIDDEDRSPEDAERGNGRFIPAADMLHIPGMAPFDARIGQGAVWLARQTIGLALQTEKFGAKYFANYAKPGGILIPPAAVNTQAREQARRSWAEAQGGENAHRIAVMPSPGWDWKAMSNNPQEAQALETKKDLRIQICSIFPVPPHMVGESQSSKSNTEQLAQEFVSYTLQPHLQAIRQEFKRKLLPNPGIGRAPKNRFYVDFDLWKLLRPTSADREKFYTTLRQWGVGSANDVREYEGLNPIDEPWADEHWMPVNMTLVDTPINPNRQDGAGNGGGTGAEGEPKPAKTQENKP